MSSNPATQSIQLRTIKSLQLFEILCLFYLLVPSSCHVEMKTIGRIAILPWQTISTYVNYARQMLGDFVWHCTTKSPFTSDRNHQSKHLHSKSFHARIKLRRVSPEGHRGGNRKLVTVTVTVIWEHSKRTYARVRRGEMQGFRNSRALNNGGAKLQSDCRRR